VRVGTIELDDNPERFNQDIHGVRPVVAKFETFLADRIHVVREDHGELTGERDVDFRPMTGAPLTAITVEARARTCAFHTWFGSRGQIHHTDLILQSGYVRRD
jgi:hypothetical protein